MNTLIFIIAIISLTVDQISKVVIFSSIKLNSSVTIIKDFFRITPYRNYGAAWGILDGRIGLLIVLTLFGIIVIYRFMRTFKLNKRNTIAFGLLIGGIVGNLSDRLFHSYVRDFLDFNFGNYYYPVFNFADSCIVVAVILLIIAIIKGEDKNENKK